MGQAMRMSGGCSSRVLGVGFRQFFGARARDYCKSVGHQRQTSFQRSTSQE